MAQFEPQYQGPDRYALAIEADAETRGDFIRKTYLHLIGAVLAFIGLEVVLFQSGLAEPIMGTLLSTKWAWLIVLGAFMGVSWLANKWAASATSVAAQYLGLSLYVVAEAVIFVPLLYIAQRFGQGIIGTAAVSTLLLFSGLTAFVLVSGKDFSFLRGVLVLGGFAGLGVIVAAMIFGFTLGIVFTVLMIALACGYILYDTSNVLHHYRIGQHVAASLALFASVALLFWYVLRLLMILQGGRR